MHKVTNIKMAQDAVFNTPIVILTSGNKSIPIWIGPFEGQHIEFVMRKSQLVRPTTYDAIVDMLNKVGVKCVRTIITELRDNIFYSILTIKDKDNKEINIDIRSSDAINIAMRCKIGIYLSDSVMKDNNVVTSVEEERMEYNCDNDEEGNVDTIDIDELDPKDFS